MEIQFTPTLATLYVCLGLEFFFIFLHFNSWLKRKSNNVHLYLALWFTNATVYTISRLFQFYSTNISLTPYYGKVGGATFFLAAYIGMLFVNNYIGYEPGKKEKILWNIAVFFPLILMITSEIFITNIPIQRYTIFNESFYGALQGNYYLPIAG